MRRDEVISKLKAAEPAIRALGANALYLYGSHARDEARPDSDVDVFIDKNPYVDFGLRGSVSLLSREIATGTLTRASRKEDFYVTRTF